MIVEFHLCHLAIGCSVMVCVTANQERNLFQTEAGEEAIPWTVKMRPPEESLAIDPHLENKHFETILCQLFYFIDEQEPF